MHRKMTVWIGLLLTSVALAASLSSISAQGPDMIEPMQISGGILKLQYEGRPAGPPSVEPLSDNRIVFSIEAAGSVSGDLQGSMTTTISEVHPVPAPPSQWFTAMFVIETENGRIEGFYAGALYRPEGADAAEVHGEGQVLSVSGVFADLYLATVFVQGSVAYQDGIGVGDNGTMVIVPR